MSRMVHSRARIAAVSLVVLVSVTTVACGGAAPAPPTAKVERGSVASRVSASGALAAVTSQNVGFNKSGKLIEVPVKVGDKVQAGQLLARVDDFPYKQALREKQGQLDQAQAKLDQFVNGNQADGAGRVESQTQDIYDATKRQVDTTNGGNDRAVALARKSLDMDKAALQAAYAAYKQSCGASATSDSNSGGTGDAATDPATGQPGQSALLSGITGGQGNPLGQLPGCDKARDTYLEKKQTYTTSKANYATAVAKRDTDRAAGKVTKENAQLDLVNARNAEELAGADRDANIDAQEAAVRSARADVALARRDVENTVLYAPMAGTVSAIQGVVGEYVRSGSENGASALAPGSKAAIPGVGAAATSDSAGNAGGGLSATRPGGNAFVVLNNLHTYQVVVPFEESDAAKVAPGQKVDVTFDAVPDLTREGTVLSIAPGGVAISGVTNYYATVVLSDTDPRLKAGQTAEAGVRTSSKDNVLLLPRTRATPGAPR